MKNPKNTIEVIDENTLESFSLGISVENLGHITSILRNSLYSNKIQAVIREVLCNARDVSVLTKTDKPISVTLPRHYQGSTFSVRDYGTGLSKELVESLYSQYGKSTKTNSNLQVGFFGIGKFAPLSYTNNFTIISYYNKIKYIYSCYVDETNIGKITLLSEEPTEEPSGLEISLVINRNDYGVFDNELNNFLRYFDYPVSINGNDPKPTVDIFAEQDILFNSTSGESGLIMGGVYYPIKSSSLKLNPEKDDEYKLLKLFSYQIMIKAKIGQVNISASRESLEYTPQTISFIVKSIKNLSDNLATSIEEEYSKLTTYVDAYAFWQKNNYKLQFCSPKVNISRYNGQSLTNRLTLRRIDPTTQEAKTLSISKLGYDYRSYSRYVFKDNYGMLDFPNNYETQLKIFYNDLPGKEAELNLRAAGWSSSSIYLIHEPKLEVIESFFNDLGYTGFTFLPASSVPQRPKTVYTRSKTEYAPVNQAYRVQGSSFAKIENETVEWEGNHYYIGRMEYNPQSVKHYFNDSAFNYHTYISLLENLYGITVYIFDAKQVKKAAKYPNLKPFSTFITQKVQEVVTDEKLDLCYYLWNIESEVLLNSIYKFYNLIPTISENQKTEIMIFRHVFSSKLTKKPTDDEHISKFYKDYPLLSKLSHFNLDDSDVIDYINYRNSK